MLFLKPVIILKLLSLKSYNRNRYIILVINCCLLVFAIVCMSKMCNEFLAPSLEDPLQIYGNIVFYLCSQSIVFLVLQYWLAIV